MALKNIYKNQEGETLNGYYRVREVHTQYEKDKGKEISLGATFVVELFNFDTGDAVDPTFTRSENKLEVGVSWIPEGTGVYSLDIPDMEPIQNLIIKSYEHLKTLEHFSEAEDC